MYPTPCQIVKPAYRPALKLTYTNPIG